MSAIIKVEKLGKKYHLGQTHTDLLSERIGKNLRSLYAKLRGRNIPTPDHHPSPNGDEFWALRDVSFEVRPGEVVGIIGRNGAGKSTLLKILSRITTPTSGNVELYGRVASLLEVGTGFHPELTGRENVYLNGAILGMSKEEIRRKFDEIVAFAEVEKFIDTPVKRYSSGMYVRLAFAVAAHLEPEILIVDEVLAVGDASFQKKCLGKMEDVGRQGRTVLFVSHNIAAVRNLCMRTLVFDRGDLTFDGAVGEGLNYYEKSFCSPTGFFTDAHFHGLLSTQLRFDALICMQNGATVDVIDPLREVQIELHGFSFKSFSRLELRLAIFHDGCHIFSCLDTRTETGMREGPFISRFDFKGDVFRPGRYTVGIGASESIWSWTWGSDIAVLDFTENSGGTSPNRCEGIVSVPYTGQRIQQCDTS